MSDRTKKLLTLALNQQLAHKINIHKRKRKFCNDELLSADPDYEPYSETKRKQVNGERQINIISNVLIRVSISPEEVATEILCDIIDSALNISEKNRERNYTKKGTLRKRKRFDIPLEQRKKAKEEKKISKYILMESCNDKCGRKCLQNITKERQRTIHFEYWNKLSENQRRQLIFSAAKNTIKKKSCVGENSRRNKTIKYYMKDENGVDFQVCKRFFLGTLGYPLHNDSIVRKVLSKTSPNELVANAIKKGHPSEKKIDRENIRNHIKSFNPTISHYRREHAPRRLYLPSDININLMHKDYLEKYPDNKISYDLYRKEVKDMNISFAILGHEECWLCESFENHIKSSKHKKDNIQSECEQCRLWDEHHKKAIMARQEYKKDASTEGGETKLFFSADLQKVRAHNRTASDSNFIEATKRDALNLMRKELDALIDTSETHKFEETRKEFDGFTKLFHRFLDETGPSVNWDKIEKLPEEAIKDYGSLEGPSAESIQQKLNKLVVVKLNGGLGTSMGCYGPKSVITVRNNLTFLDLAVQQLEVVNFQITGGKVVNVTFKIPIIVAPDYIVTEGVARCTQALRFCRISGADRIWDYIIYLLLGRWRGSVYKLVWRELLAYLLIYYTVNLIYRFALTEPQQRVFEKVRMYFSQQSETIPMSFVLGFYVSLVVKRWWDQYKLLPWPDTLALFLNAGIPGANERQRLMRRNIVRYAVLAYVITLQRVSLRVKKRFPTWQHVVDSGLMMESERKIFELMDQRTPMSKYWMPLVWATNIINRARKESIISSDHIVQTLLMELSDIRRRLGALIGYDTVNVPLVYTQVVSLALYVYFIAALLGRQFVPYADPSIYKSGTKWEVPDMYFPFFTSLQFCFYIGWLKVAEVLINPFGEDDDDIELNWLIDRHIKASYMIVDEMHEEHPELLKDQYWEDVVPKDLPYTVASEHYRKEEPKGSADNYKIKAQDAVYANIITPKKSLLGEDMYADYESVDTPIVERRKSSNWFSRQISRTGMGSIRSASTAYSSGGLFARHRGNSVYANPENGQLPGLPPAQKMTIYDRLVGRRSGRSRNMKHNSKLAGAAPMQVKNRPRIPTPDVTKEVVDRENRIAASVASMQNQMSANLTLMPHQLPANYSSYSGEMPVVQVVLSPIQELDGTGSVNNTLHAHQPGTAALAQAVLSPGLGPVLTNTPSVSVPMTVSQLTSLGFTSHHGSPLLTKHFEQQSVRNPAFIQAFDREKFTSPPQTLSLTEIAPEDEQPPLSTVSNGSVNSEASSSSKNSVASNMSNTTASVTSNKSVDVQNDISEHDGPDKNNFIEQALSPEVSNAPMAVPFLSVPTVTIPPGNLEVSVLIPASPTFERAPAMLPTETTGESLPVSLGTSSSLPSVSTATSSTVALNSTPLDSVKVRKITPISQSGKDSPKREVYV